MFKARYYEPRAVEVVAGVRHRPLDTHRDLYEGSADALQQARVLFADMLPSGSSITWRPSTGKPSPRGGWMAVPGYMTVYRRSALYRVHLTVSIEEQERRGEVQQAQDARWHEDRRVREAAAARARLATEFQHMSEADFRHYICTGLRITGTLLWEHTATSKAQANAIYPYRLPANTYARIRGLLIEVDQLLDQCELERADALQLARADAKFQAFLAGQCIAGEE